MMLLSYSERKASCPITVIVQVFNGLINKSYLSRPSVYLPPLSRPSVYLLPLSRPSVYLPPVS